MTDSLKKLQKKLDELKPTKQAVAFSSNFSGMHPEPNIIEKSNYYEVDPSKNRSARNTEWKFGHNSLTASKILMTDDNMKPMMIEHPAQNTEFHIIRGSDTLYVNVGESWTYGEILFHPYETKRQIITGSGQYHLDIQLQYCFGTRIAEATGWDYYQFAIPGNCNLYMHTDLERILKHVATLGYKKVYVSMQLTDPSRELNISNTKLFKSHPINDWFHYPVDNKIHIVDWLAMYDEIFFNHYNKILNSFTACPIEGIMWRNFTKFVSNKRDYNFKFIETNWVTHTAKLVNHDNVTTHMIMAYVFDDYKHKVGKNLIIPLEWMENEVEAIHRMHDYIGMKSVPGQIYHNNHPTYLGHLVWAHHLMRQAGWKDI
jgi:hypothetical protein